MPSLPSHPRREPSRGPYGASRRFRAGRAQVVKRQHPCAKWTKPLTGPWRGCTVTIPRSPESRRVCGDNSGRRGWSQQPPQVVGGFAKWVDGCRGLWKGVSWTSGRSAGLVGAGSTALAGSTRNHGDRPVPSVQRNPSPSRTVPSRGRGTSRTAEPHGKSRTAEPGGEGRFSADAFPSGSAGARHRTAWRASAWRSPPAAWRSPPRARHSATGARTHVVNRATRPGRCGRRGLGRAAR